MPSINITKFDATEREICRYFNSLRPSEELQIIFNVAMNDEQLFPNAILPSDATYHDYIDRWVQRYIRADNNPASNRIANPKGSCNDPAIRAIVKMATQATDKQADLQEIHHNLFMSAENVQGDLLEEYIDSVVYEHGWVWCKGDILRSVDFCTEDGRLLQIKNKSNSENSSSSRVRIGTNIEKWHRLGTRIRAGERTPVYYWEELNRIIEKTSGQPCNMSEYDYINYVEKIARNNPQLITDL